MNGDEKSDSVVVPLRQMNKTGKTAAESAEERTLAKGNTPQPLTDRTQRRETVSAGLWRVCAKRQGGTSRKSSQRYFTM